MIGPNSSKQDFGRMLRAVTHIGVQSDNLTTVMESNEIRRFKFSEKPTTHVFVVRVRLATSSGSAIKINPPVSSSPGFQGSENEPHSPADFVEGHALIRERLPLAQTVVDGLGEARCSGKESRRNTEEESGETHCDEGWRLTGEGVRNELRGLGMRPLLQNDDIFYTIERPAWQCLSFQIIGYTARICVSR